jgi:hypothetical protein
VFKQCIGSVQKVAMVDQRQEKSDLVWALWTVTAAFGCYFCMYAFRKPFTAASYSSIFVFGVGFKSVLIIAQVLGYMISKFLGVKIIAEMRPGHRVWGLVILVAVAELALILFGLIPRPWNAICLFFNGIALGLVFGLVLGFLEGKRCTEALVAGLCASFILADGVTKSTGALILNWGVAEDWMPSVAGALFAIPFACFVAMLTRVPQPSIHDVAARSERHVMSNVERIMFLNRHGIGLIPLVIVFLCVTLLRSVRADFAPEIWRALGHPAAPAIFSVSELWVALGVVVVNGSTVIILDNRKALFTALGVCGLGIGVLIVALLTQRAGSISSLTFMILLGLGLYLPYVAMHTTVFERILALTRDRGNVGFLLYVADSVGYLGYVVVVLARQFWSANLDFLVWLSNLSWITIGISVICLAMSWRHYATKYSATVSETVTAPGSVEGLT